MLDESFTQLLQDIKSCKICDPYLALGANPVMSAHPNSKIIIIGQAPGLKVHESGIAWNDKSGDKLRTWLGVDRDTFYNPENFALMPMGFCYPGKGSSGDLPPRKECAPQWHTTLLERMHDVKLILLIGHYAQQYYLKDTPSKTLTETVQDYALYLPTYFPLPHPSPRNFIWQTKNPYFQELILPELKKIIQTIDLK